MLRERAAAETIKLSTARSSSRQWQDRMVEIASFSRGEGSVERSRELRVATVRWKDGRRPIKSGERKESLALSCWDSRVGFKVKAQGSGGLGSIGGRRMLDNSSRTNRSESTASWLEGNS